MSKLKSREVSSPDTSKQSVKESSSKTPLASGVNKLEGLSWKAVCISVILIYFAAKMVVNAQIGQLYVPMSVDGVPSGLAVFVLLVLLGILYIVKRITGKELLTKGELLTIYWMVTVGGLVLGMGYFAYHIFQTMGWQSTLNLYRQNINLYKPLFDNFSSLLLPKSMEATRGFWFGNNGVVPWNEWIGPIITWSVFATILYLFILCLHALVIRQWIDVERLVFPVVGVVEELIGESTDITTYALDKPKQSFWKSPAAWTGMLIAGILFSGLRGLNRYFPAVPTIPTSIPFLEPYLGNLPDAIRHAITSWPPLFPGRVHWPLDLIVTGIAFLVNLDVSFSVWFFALLYALARGIAISATGHPDIAGVFGIYQPYVTSIGAFFGLALFSLWTMRERLKKMWIYAFSSKKTENQDFATENDTMPYRLAFIGVFVLFVLILAFCYVFFHLDVWVSFIYFLCFIAITLSWSRIRAEVGWPNNKTYNQFYEYLFMENVFGLKGLGNKNLAGMSFFGHISYGGFMGLGANVSEAYRSCDSHNVRLRSVTLALCIAFLAALIFGWITYLPFIYTKGAIFTNSEYTRLASWFTTAFESYSKEIEDPALGRLWYVLGGAVIVLGLSYLRSMFVWFPLHPAGFVLAIKEGVAWFWPCFFMAWLVKSILYRYGGSRSVAVGKQFFIGLVVGSFAVTGVFNIIGIFIQP